MHKEQIPQNLFKKLADGVEDNNLSLQLLSVIQEKWKTVRAYWTEQQVIIVGVRISKE